VLLSLAEHGNKRTEINEAIDAAVDEALAELSGAQAEGGPTAFVDDEFEDVMDEPSSYGPMVRETRAQARRSMSASPPEADIRQGASHVR
jgi:hypothetical protein